MILVDTDILIGILRNDESRKSAFREAVIQSNGEVYISPVQIAEIFAGMRESERTATECFLDSLHCLAIRKETGKLAGEFMRQFSKSHDLKIADATIAAIAKTHSFKLWTDNKKHYPMLSPSQFY